MPSCAAFGCSNRSKANTVGKSKLKKGFPYTALFSVMAQPQPVKSIRDDPLYYLDFVQKFVQIKTVNNKVYQGTIFTVDPKSDNVVLISHLEGKPCIDVIMGRMVRSIQTCSQPPGSIVDTSIGDKILKNRDESKDSVLSPVEITKRKQQLKDWLSANLVSVTEEGDLLKLDDILVVHPPYGVNQCTCSNQIILGKVQALIKKMVSES